MNKKHSRCNPQSEARFKEMVDLYESGLTLEKVGLRFGISKQRVMEIFNQAGVKKRKYTSAGKKAEKKKWQPRIIPKETLTELYVEKKMPVPEIQKKLKVGSGVFYRSLAFHQIPERNSAQLKKLPDEREALRRMYIEEGLTAIEIARRLDCALITVRTKLAKHGIRKLSKPDKF